jgi:DNA-3-methyladenine glycosylase
LTLAQQPDTTFDQMITKIHAESRRILPVSFYARRTLTVARDLLGKHLVREISGTVRTGRIIEVEAYVGPHDHACHAHKGRTKRTEVLFRSPGLAYVYLIYGMYHCLNVVTERLDYPAAVLIRAVEDETGLIDGPGRVCRAYGIDLTLNYHNVTTGQKLWFEDCGKRPPRSQIGSFPRIGVDYAGKWATRPWRFRIAPIGIQRGKRRSHPRSIENL